MNLIFQAIGTFLFLQIFFSSQAHGATQRDPCHCWFVVKQQNKVLYEEGIGGFWGLGGTPTGINHACQSLCTQKVIERFNADQICDRLGAASFTNRHDISIGFRSWVKSRSCSLFKCSNIESRGNNDNVRKIPVENCDKCRCKLRYHKTSRNETEPNPGKSLVYPKSQASLCTTSCQSHLPSFISPIAQQRMDKACADLSPGVSMQEHGIALWYQKNDDIHFYDKNICCRAKCECSVLNGQDLFLKELETPTKNRGFHCGAHLKDCMVDCRNSAALYFENQSIVNSTSTTPDLNIFNAPNYNSVSAMFVCSKLNEQTSIQGVPIYLQYDSGENVYPYREKLHLGNICCIKDKSGQIVPINCKDMENRIL